jgi:DNA-binding SARP family transcriptional activator/TolB-like protein
MDSDRLSWIGAEPNRVVRMLGRLTISRDGVAVTLPASRKVRGLMAYLALAPNPVTRTHLCELLWDVPNDPRGELRWCLSKVRGILADPERQRLETYGDTVKLDLADCFVDIVEIARAAQAGIERLATERLQALSLLFSGDFLEGLEIDRSPHFQGWLVAQRRRFRGCHIALLEHLARHAPADSDELLGYLDKWLELAPFDLRGNELLLRALAERGRIREGEERLAAAVRIFQAEGLDDTPLRDAWRLARSRKASESLAIIATAAPAPPPLKSGGGEVVITPRRASIAVMPFADRTVVSGAWGGLPDGLAHDVITRLAKLRSFFVIAQGTVFTLHERSVGPEDAGRILNVDYIVSGSVRRHKSRVTITVELAEVRTARIVWREAFDHKRDEALLAVDEIADRIVGSIADEIEANERNRALLKPPNSLDAWEAYHRGLWHIYRFSRGDNEQAQHFFEMAVRLDPTFSRAYAGLSFAHFTKAFQRWGDREHETALALEAAGHSLVVDERDPAAHWAMGRAMWLCGRLDQSLVELGRSVDLSPSFAHGHYALSWVHAESGDARVAIKSSERARRLSPFDPLLFSILAARAAALLRLRRFEEAADYAVQAAAQPNAHVHIRGIAAHCLALAGRCDEARCVISAIHKVHPQYRVDDLIATFHTPPDIEALFREAAKRIR